MGWQKNAMICDMAKSGIADMLKVRKQFFANEYRLKLKIARHTSASRGPSVLIVGRILNT